MAENSVAVAINVNSMIKPEKKIKQEIIVAKLEQGASLDKIFELFENNSFLATIRNKGIIPDYRNVLVYCSDWDDPEIHLVIYEEIDNPYYEKELKEYNRVLEAEKLSGIIEINKEISCLKTELDKIPEDLKIAQYLIKDKLKKLHNELNKLRQKNNI